MRLTRVVQVAAVTAVTVLGGATIAQAAPVVISSGHVDVVEAEYEDGALEVHLHDHTVDPAVDRDPAAVVLEAVPGTKTTVPSAAAYRFLGTAGSPVWVLPQDQRAGVLFAGLSAENVQAGTFAGDKLDFALTRATGPGRVSVFDTDAAGSPTVLYHSGDGLPDVHTVHAGDHHHTNWAFTAAGTYTLTFDVTATRSDGTAVDSGPATYTFKVDA
ncbi:choice-of-anchor M domain-containing protein [Amycolatopsis sp. PS_44_ISF1]|uniref:choice-of-anchor M domain-containing protein n=1 Tax=Amycolatopsis sp. PS_44_ISF1 TaxID=2974917 RepID=UPI0028DF6E11|nr:choice-of-anchor M domain-containing protein [Amycolatopsis sp. PS_44_ISF1]MDT8914957.1 choice-of-anchor M domain-containing protein [Amycolatopsis sp. PS_44_ISF1]